MRAVVRVFLTVPTKSIEGSSTYKKLSAGKLFIYLYTKKFFPKYGKKYGSYELLEMGFFHRQARGRWRQASSVLFTHTPLNS